MKRKFKKLTAILSTVAMIAAMLTLPVSAADIVKSENFDNLTTGPWASNWITNASNYGANKTISDTVFKGESGKSVLLTTAADTNIMLNSNGLTGQGVFEVSFDIRFNEIANYGFDVVGTPKTLENIKLDAAGSKIWYRSGGTAYPGIPVVKDTWYNIRFLIDTVHDIAATYVDNKPVYIWTSYVLDSVQRITTKINNCYLDNFVVKQYENTGVTVNFTNETPSGETLGVTDMFTSLRASVSGNPLATYVKFETSADNTTWTTAYTAKNLGAVIDAGITSSGYVRASACCENIVLGTSESIKTEGPKGNLIETFSMDFTNFSKDTLGNYNYNILHNSSGYGVNNTIGAQIEASSAVVGTTGVDLADGVHGEVVKMSASTADARFDPMTAYQFGVKNVDYDAAAGTTYDEKMPSRYIVLSGDFMFPDFNARKYLFSNHYNNSAVRWSQMGCIVIEPQEIEGVVNNDKGVIVIKGNTNTKASVVLEENTWYNIIDVFDLKTSTAYAFVNKMCVGSASFKGTVSEFKNINTVIIQMTKNTTNPSEMYFDNFSATQISFPYEIEASKYFVNEEEASVFSPGAVTQNVVIKNDGTERAIYLFSGIYDKTDAALDSVKVTKVDFAKGDLWKNVNVNIGTAASNKFVKTIIIDNIASLLPLKTADVLQ